MQKRIALLYDFDYTLAHGFMQEFGLMQEFGFDDVMKFFKACEESSLEPDMDMCLSSLCGILELAKKGDKKVTKEYLKQFGKDIKYMGLELKCLGSNLDFSLNRSITK